MSILLPAQTVSILYVCNAAVQVSLMHKVLFGVFFQETVTSPSVSSEFLFSPSSSFPFTGSNHLPSVFVNNLGYWCDCMNVCVCVWQSADSCSGREELYVY